MTQPELPFGDDHDRERVDSSQERTRPDWDQYFLLIAHTVKTRSDCVRDQVGAVVVKDRRIRATGYNGAPMGKSGCHSCPRRYSDVPSGSSYDNCVAVHAEANALLYCDREDLHGATLYITREACYACSKLIEASGVERVVFRDSEGQVNST